MIELNEYEADMREVIRENGERIPIGAGDRIVRIRTVRRDRALSLMPQWAEVLYQRWRASSSPIELYFHDKMVAKLKEPVTWDFLSSEKGDNKSVVKWHQI